MVMGATARVRTEGGFSLIELMIAVAIVAVLAALAMPLYNQYSMRSVRTAAQGDLLLCQQGLERFASVLKVFSSCLWVARFNSFALLS